MTLVSHIPRPSFMELFTLFNRTDPRALGSMPPDLAEKTNNFTYQQTIVLSALALTAATISIVAGLLSLYWFIRMRKTFRHHLIMLLILSNFWRALWYFVSAIVSFMTGPLQAGTHFCEASGFLVSVGMEGAVLVMALHACLCIFKPRTSLGETGLYEYRYVVYGLWSGLPVLAGGLAFVNSVNAYVSSGTYCYLPIRPFWYRLALAWIPRYLILLSIGLMYLAIYLFVKRNFAKFPLSSHSSDKIPSGAIRGADSAPKSKRESGADTMLGTPFMSQRTTRRQSSENQSRSTSTPAWEGYTFGSSSPMPMMCPSDTIELGSSSIASPDGQRPPFSETFEKTHTIYQALQDITPPTTDVTASASAPGLAPLELFNSRNQPVETEDLWIRHRAIRRQMRFLFIYPIVYLFLWLVPFVQHCLDYSDSYASNPNFGLSCASTVILALQCAVDAILFTMREKPWRHRDVDNEEEKTILGSLNPWNPSRDRSKSMTLRFPLTPSSAFKRSLTALASINTSTLFSPRALSGGGATGKSKGERLAEARAARTRKQAEVAQARETAENQRQRRKMSLLRRDGRDRSWWEEEGKQRKDSVMLGTDSDGAADRVGPGRPRARAETVVDTIGEEPEKEEASTKPAIPTSAEQQSEEGSQKSPIFFKPRGVASTPRGRPSYEDDSPLASRSRTNDEEPAYEEAPSIMVRSGKQPASTAASEKN